MRPSSPWTVIALPDSGSEPVHVPLQIGSERIIGQMEKTGSEPTVPGSLGAALLTGPVACVDLETTGGMAAHDRVLEVGIVLLDRGVVVEQWSSLVNPGRRIPSGVEQFTGIDDAMVADAPSFADLRDEIRRRLEGRLFVAHNARFDFAFLRREFRRAGEPFAAPVLCTVRLSRALCPDEHRHNLDALIARYGLCCEARHRALGDARVLPALLAALEARVGHERLDATATLLLRTPALPPNLPAGLADELPDAPGVYIFRGEDGAPIYVGKGRNLRSSVLAHFPAQARETRQGRLAQDVRDVDWIETGGEIGALLLESRLVRELAPAENRRHGACDEAHCIRLRVVDAATRVCIEPLEEDALANDAEAYGPFRGADAARKALAGKARDSSLCLKLLGLETGEGSCIGFQLGRCRGACAGREPRALHDTRLRLALATLRIRPWPFPGAVGIRERAPGSHATVLHVIDRWQHLGSVGSDDELAALIGAQSSPAFDADTYRILNRRFGQLDPRAFIPLTPHGPGA
jgi:DNA polymerase III subunit epsilon